MTGARAPLLLVAALLLATVVAGLGIALSPAARSTVLELLAPRAAQARVLKRKITTQRRARRHSHRRRVHRVKARSAPVPSAQRSSPSAAVSVSAAASASSPGAAAFDAIEPEGRREIEPPQAPPPRPKPDEERKIKPVADLHSLVAVLAASFTLAIGVASMLRAFDHNIFGRA